MNITIGVRQGEVLLDHISTFDRPDKILHVYIDCRTKYPSLVGCSDTEFILEPRERFDGQRRGPTGEYTIISFEGIPDDHQMFYLLGKYSLQVLWLPRCQEGKRIWEAPR